MKSHLDISLNNVRFRAFHGLYPEERQKGNDFVVNMSVTYPSPAGVIAELSNTIDYSSLFDIMNRIMQQPVDLLETLVQSIAGAVREAYPQITAIAVQVEKLNPPIDRFEGSATVTYRATY